MPARRSSTFVARWPDVGAGTPPGPSTFPDLPEGVVDPTVSILVQQFGLMQQQMFDQFHQTMMMMFEGFATLHRETSDNFRDEFDEVRRLSQEIESLRLETARLAEEASKAEARPIEEANGRRPADDYRPADHRPIPDRPTLDRPVYEPITKPTAPTPNPDVDIHAQLCLRLASIQAERQNRWQRILGMMSSRS